ncbi:MAG: Ldh family oxidoreductase [Acidimicrobiaceae bacterium]|nr:Ldh family oxidoreductase [Acidimicrobiaceae bacterium]MYB86586.1 Ldh family oxidoreductase [Acidimicrobiaceae bacterium]MYH92955.1 Ldh family oxidoreductase [Acidimicrobiaceae bacterium]
MSDEATKAEPVHVVGVEELIALATDVMTRVGCDLDIAAEIAEHLVGADLCGVPSHGTMRLTQYAKQAQTGYLNPEGRPSGARNPAGRIVVDGNGGFGHPAAALGMRLGLEECRDAGMSVVAVQNCGHTGRLGTYSDTAAAAGMFSIVCGGGRRDLWPQVAPHGGIDPKLPTNPYCFGFPAGDGGPVIADFATGMVSGGKVMNARVRGMQLDGEYLLTADGTPSADPGAYLDGGAIRPFAGARGYGMGLVAEIIAMALIGGDTPEGNWLILLVDTSSYQAPDALRTAVGEILDDVRSSRTAPGIERVEIPGQREHALAEQRRHEGIPIPESVWTGLIDLHERLGRGRTRT